MRYLKILTVLSVVIPLLHAEQYTDLISHLQRMNCLTMRSVKRPPEKQVITHIHHLVRSIYRFNKVPLQTLLEINNNYFMVYRDIELYPKDQFVFIYSRGYAKSVEPGTNGDFIQRGACAKGAYVQIRDHIVPPHYPLISFDYDDDRDGFAFGQEQEIAQLETIYKSVLLKNPNAQIILIGDCRGGKVALELATRQPKNLNALILMAPFISGRDITNNLAKHHLGYLPMREAILHYFFKFYFKQYDESKNDLIARLHHIDPQLPIFIGHRINDQLVSTETIKLLAKTLDHNGNSVQLCITHDQSEPHSKLTNITGVQQGIRSFLGQYCPNLFQIHS